MKLVKILAGSVLACVAMAAQAIIPAPWSSLIVFGDSLSDPGNAAALTPQAPGIPSFFPPTPNGRFSNGPTAAEVLASKLGVPTVLGWPNAAGATNFAVGGAKSGNGNFNFDVNSPFGLATIPAYATVGSTGIGQQIARFQPSVADYGTTPLFLLQGGANDFFLGSALERLFPNTQNFNAIVATAANNMANNLSALVAKGAKNILVPNLPDLGLTPFALQEGSSFAAQATALTNGYNNLLSNVVATADASLDPSYQIAIVDVDTYTREVIANPPAGLDNVTDSCLASQAAIASNCAGYLFWDSVHPTALGHQLSANLLFAAAVPEPEVWLLMLVGAGLVALRARRRV